MGLGSNASRGCNLMVLGVSRICDWALLNEQDFVFLCEISQEGLGEAFFKNHFSHVSAVVECHGKGDNVVMGLLLADTCSCAGVGL